MALSLFNFTKSWRNAQDFPTFEADEAQVRDDMQCLFDEVKDGLNGLVGEISAANVPFTPTAEVDSSDVQNAIENVQSQIAAAILGELPDGSVTTAKLADNAVSGQKLADDAVTEDKLSDGAVTEDKLSDGAVKEDKIADGAVTEDKLADASVGLSKLSAEALSAKADIVDGKVRPTQLSKSRVNVTASRALMLTDDGKVLYCASDSAVTLTIPLNSAVQLPVGAEIVLYRAGLGSVSVAGAEGVTVNCSAGLSALQQYDSMRLKKWGANEWSAELDHNPPAPGSITGTELADGAVTSAKLASGAVSTAYTATLDTSWTGESAPYTKEVTVSGILASDAPIVDIVPSDTFSTAEAQEEAWANVYKVTASAGKLTFYAKEKPTAALPVKILCIRK